MTSLFRFLGGSLRYNNAKQGLPDLRFGYQFAASFDLDSASWGWCYGIQGRELPNYIVGVNKTDANVTNLVITGVPANYYETDLESRLVFKVEIGGEAYTVYDRVRSRNVYGIAQNMIKNPTETQDAKAYAQIIVDYVASRGD